MTGDNLGPSPVVLVVEDEPGILDAVTLLLELEGFRVIGAGDGHDALSKLSEERCDLLITDLMMPKMDGEELVRRLRADPRYAGMQILLMSAGISADADIVDHVDAFLCKPFALDRLLQVIRLLLEQRREPAGPGGGPSQDQADISPERDL